MWIETQSMLKAKGNVDEEQRDWMKSFSYEMRFPHQAEGIQNAESQKNLE